MTEDIVHDMVIIGGGPAGLTAGLYAARARLNALLLEQMGFGGQLLTYERVDNYPGFPEGIGAFGLAELISAQALRFGLQVRNTEVRGLDLKDKIKKVILSNGVYLHGPGNGNQYSRCFCGGGYTSQGTPADSDCRG